MEKLFLENVFGYEDIKKELKLIRDWYLENKIERRKLPRGILFYGEPGVGKTHLVREYSKEFNCPIFVIDGDNTNLLNEITETYDKARKEKLAVVVIDELYR